MTWLLWREYRLNRPILLMGVFLLLAPNLTVLIWWASKRLMSGAPVSDSDMRFGAAAIYGIALSQLTFAFLGGNAFAGERADRSAEFVAYLPVSRKRRLAAKACLALIAAACIWGVFLPLQLSEWFRLLNEKSPDTVGFFVITGLAIFGVAWLVSSFQSSPTFAVAGGLLTPVVIVTSLIAVDSWLDLPSTQRFAKLGYAIVCPIVGSAGLAIASWLFLRRVEP